MNYCPFIKNPINFTSLKKIEDKKLLKIIRQVQQKKLYLETGPLEISLAHSGSCNLRCKMCISNTDFNPPEPKLEQIIFKQIIPSLLPELEVIKLSGNGDPFFQKETREFLQTFPVKKFPDIKFEILTNGLLLNEKMWNSIKHNKFKSINISIDAASKETYEKIRIGGQWETLQNNLKFISKLKKQQKIEKFFINMTVMKSNYKELKDFALMGKKLDCDKVYFHKIFGLRYLQDLEENINIFPDLKILKRIKIILKDPFFNSPQVNIEGIKEYCSFKPKMFASVKSKLKLFICKVFFNKTTRRLRKKLSFLKKLL